MLHSKGYDITKKQAQNYEKLDKIVPDWRHFQVNV
jgi:hypothetical protein